MSICVRRAARTRLCAGNEVFTALFHSSSPLSWKNKKRGSSAAESSSPTDSVAPEKSRISSSKQKSQFIRDPLPHTGGEEEGSMPASPREERNPSFRRRSSERNERDWNQRTGKWSASRFGGGAIRGSQMGLREDRPHLYGLGNRLPGEMPLKQPFTPRLDQPPREAPNTPFPRRPTTRPFGLRPEGDEHEVLKSDERDEARTGPPLFERRRPASSTHSGPQQSPVRILSDRSETSFPRLPTMHRPFGLRPEGDEHEGPKRYERDEGRTSPPSLGRRRPASSSNQAFRQTLPFPRPWVSQSDYEGPIEGGRSERRRSEARTRDEGFTEDVDSGEPDLASRPLKNRNQPTAAASPAPSVPQDKPVTPPPTPRLDVSLFYNAPIILSRKSGVRAGVPVVTKSDPATASTISSYSPAMGQDHVLPAKFTSPPLLPGLLKCLTDVVGRDAAPTEIQALSLKWIVEPWTVGQENLPATTTQEVAVRTETGEDHFKEILLASETGSGKSIAYLLPVLQALKLSETRRLAEEATPIASKRGLNPRALILAPTHELARQLSGFAKDLLHDVKLRVLCASRANAPTRAARDPTVAGSGKKKNSSASRMKALLSFADDGQMGEFQVKQADLGPQAFPVDVVVGTPMKLLEMVRGRGWERAVEFGGGVATESPEQEDNKLEEGAEGKERAPKLRRGRDSLPGVGKWRSSPEMGLSEVEWVVVDEADVLFDPDFQETTRILLADISKARGRDIPVVPLPVGLKAPSAPTPVPIPTTSRQKEKEKKEQEKEQAQGKIVAKGGPSAITPLNYPFNFLIASATIPKSLSTYLNAYHPGLLRFITESANHLPKTVRTEYVNWSGGNKNADIERRLRKVWAADAADGLGPGPESLGDMSKVLIFCNRNTKVTDLGEFLEEKGIKNVQLSSSSENRKRGNNNHLNGFLKTAAPDSTERPDDWSSSWVADEDGEGEKKEVPKRSLLPIARIDPQAKEKPINDPMNVPHVMITTSLLSRGLDFSPKVNHVFIIDDPRNEIDFLHRAGRTGRAGKHGKVVIFGKLEGRGSQRSKEVRKKIKALRG